AAYEPTALVTGSDAGAGSFREPSDLHVTPDGSIYVADSGNNRIVVLDGQFRAVETIDSFDSGGAAETFLNPQGLFVTENGHLYVADTGHKRVVHLDGERKLVKLIEAPESELLQSNFDFLPVRVVVDHAQR